MGAADAPLRPGEAVRPHGERGAARSGGDAASGGGDRRLPRFGRPGAGAGPSGAAAGRRARRQCGSFRRRRRDRSAASGGRSWRGSAASRLAALSPLLEARARGGYVRHCHGDLHLRNIVEIDGVAGAVRRHRVRRSARHHRRSLRSRVPADGSRQARTARATPMPCSTPISMRRRAPAISLDWRRCRSSWRCGRRSEPRSRCCARAWRRAIKPTRRVKRPAPISPWRESFLAPAAPRLIAIGGLSGTGKSAVARAIAPFDRRLSRRGACAQRCRAQAPVRGCPVGAAAGKRLCAGDFRSRLCHVPQACR